MKHVLLRGSWILVLSSFVWLVPLAAQGDPPAQDEAEAAPELSTYREELNVGARPIASLAGGATVLDRPMIEASGSRTVGDLLKHVEGVHVLSNGSRGGLTTAQIRGGDPNFALVLLDGVLLNNSADLEGGAVNLAGLSTSSVERVEVARGPHSYFYGPNAIAGLINIVTRRGEAGTRRFGVGLEAGDFSQLRAETSASGPMGDGDYFAGVEWEEENGRLGDDSFQQASALANLGFSIGDEGRLRLHARAAAWEADDYPDASGGPVFGSGELRSSENDEFTFGADLALDGSGRWRNRISASLRRQDVVRTSPAVGFLVPPSREDITYSRVRGSWLASFDVSPTTLFAAGIDLDSEDATNDSVLILPPFLGGEIAGDYELARTTPGAFTEVVADRGRLLLEAGIRADMPENRDSEWSPRLAARYTLGEGATVLRGSVSRAFKLPSFSGLGSPRALGGNPDLKPETSEGVELGLERQFGAHGLSAGASAFLVRYSDLIEFDFDIFQLVNRARVEAQGVETYLRWNPSSRLRVQASLTWQDVEDIDVGGAPLHQPEWTGGAFLHWQPEGRMTVALEARLTSGSLDQQLTAPDRSSVSGYELLNASFSWQLTDDLRLRAQVDNLADREYENFIGFTEPGRSGRVSLRYTFKQDRAVK